MQGWHVGFGDMSLPKHGGLKYQHTCSCTKKHLNSFNLSNFVPSPQVYIHLPMLQCSEFNLKAKKTYKSQHRMAPHKCNIKLQTAFLLKKLHFIR